MSEPGPVDTGALIDKARRIGAIGHQHPGIDWYELSRELLDALIASERDRGVLRRTDLPSSAEIAITALEAEAAALREELEPIRERHGTVMQMLADWDQLVDEVAVWRGRGGE